VRTLRQACALAALFSLSLCCRGQELDTSENPWSLTRAEWVGAELFGGAEFARLDALAQRLLKSRERAKDGRFQLALLDGGIEERIAQWATSSPGVSTRLVADWKKAVPDSAYRPIVEVLVIRANAWAMRGEGAASEVTAEGWQLFKEANEAARQVLMESRKRASAFPGWYSEAIELAFETNRPRAEIDSLLREGIERFPGYFPLYFSYLNYLQPKWGGSFEQANAFIVEQTMSPANPDGEVLYARLYWFFDQCDVCSDRKYFENSKVDWVRLRKGFDRLTAAYPDSERNLAAFTDFACRANDAATYKRLRARLNTEVFGSMSHIPLERCDARFHIK
jgi:hypothetical protein